MCPHVVQEHGAAAKAASAAEEDDGDLAGRLRALEAENAKLRARLRVLEPEEMSPPETPDCGSVASPLATSRAAPPEALRSSRCSGGGWEVALLLALLGSYLSVGAVVYSSVETDEFGAPWTVVDALYFTTATMSTVGYGDLFPGSEGMQVFTLFMILFGIICIFPRVASVVSAATRPFTKRGQSTLEFIFPQEAVDIDGDGLPDYKVPRHAVIYYSKGFLPSLLLTCVLQLTSAWIFTLLEGWTYWESFYHCMVTGTTVGYGDMAICSQEGRLWASVHIMLSVCMVGEKFAMLEQLRQQRASELEEIRQLGRRLDEDLLDQLLEQARRLRPKVVRDGLGLTELEFAMAMLIELEIVKLSQVQPFIKQFRELDVDSNGRLGKDDLSIVQILGPEACAKLRIAHSGAPMAVGARAMPVLNLPQVRRAGLKRKTPRDDAEEGGGGEEDMVTV